MSACDACLGRPWLLTRLAGHLDNVRARVGDTLGLSNASLIAALAGTQRERLLAELAGFDSCAARDRAAAAKVELICRCDPDYPAVLAELDAPPAVLHVSGGLNRFLRLAAEPSVAVVGARDASAYGLEVGATLAHDLGSAGVTVVSGMAPGVDSAAHAGALSAGGPTIAVLPGGPERAYPASKHALRRRIAASGAVVSELPPGTSVRRWMFPARNRIIAALSAMTVVVEASERSGALLTAANARELGRPVGAVPGRVSSRLASGPNRLIAGGAVLVSKAQDALDEVFGFGVHRPPAVTVPAGLAPEVVAVLDAIGDGFDTPAALVRAGFVLEPALAAVASLELAGLLHRAPGGRLTPSAFSHNSLVEPEADRNAPAARAPRARMTSRPRARCVLSIAGSDSGGGAGIQADLKAFAACRVHGMTAITAITAQNTLGVSAVHTVPAPTILAQVRAVAADIGIDAVKIGMLGTVSTIEAVRIALDELPAGTPVVLDPVLVAESGAELLESSARTALIELLLPRATVATPNIPEARALTGLGDEIAGPGDEITVLARAVHALGPAAVVVTGGHSERAADVFFDGITCVEIAGERHPGEAAHGSGCTHSAALAASLAWGLSPLQAAHRAKELAGAAVRDGLSELGGGPGPVDVIGLGHRR